jgi:hypothetical protein
MKTNQTKTKPPTLSRRKFMLTGGAAAAAFTIVPRHVLGGAGFVAPSEKITLAYIGCGTQGLREMLGMLAMPEVQIVAVCDPVKDSLDYVDWSKDGLRASIASALGKPDWRRGTPGIPGGRDVAKEIIETFYANQRRSEKFSGCAGYGDFRELLEKEKDLNADKSCHTFFAGQRGLQHSRYQRMDRRWRNRHAPRNPQLVQPPGVASVSNHSDRHSSGSGGL